MSHLKDEIAPNSTGCACGDFSWRIDRSLLWNAGFLAPIAPYQALLMQSSSHNLRGGRGAATRRFPPCALFGAIFLIALWLLLFLYFDFINDSLQRPAQNAAGSTLGAQILWGPPFEIKTGSSPEPEEFCEPQDPLYTTNWGLNGSPDLSDWEVASISISKSIVYNEEREGGGRVAFMFLVRAPIPLERLWARFFEVIRGPPHLFFHFFGRSFNTYFFIVSLHPLDCPFFFILFLKGKRSEKGSKHMKMKTGLLNWPWQYLISVECVMLSVTRAQPWTVEHVMPRSARAQPRVIFPSVRLFPRFVKFESYNSRDSLNFVRT